MGGKKDLSSGSREWLTNSREERDHRRREARLGGARDRWGGGEKMVGDSGGKP